MPKQVWWAEYTTMVEDCLKHPNDLNTWEANFLTSLKARLKNSPDTLTKNQTETLESIWGRLK